MKRGSPRDYRIPFWARREFRWLLGIAVLALSLVAALAWKMLSPPPVLPERHQDFLDAEDLASPPFLELREAKDLTPANEEDPAYLALVERIRGTEPGELARRAKRVEFETLLREPDRVRGRVVRMVALHISPVGSAVDALPISFEEGRVEWIYRVHLMEPSGNEGYVLHLVDRPPEVEHRSLVTADAVFLKWIRYETGPWKDKDGKEHHEREAPLLVGRTITPAPVTGRPVRVDEGQLFFALAIVSAVLIGLTIMVFLLGMRSRRRLPERPPRSDVSRVLPVEGKWKRPTEWKPPVRPPARSFFHSGARRFRRLQSPDAGAPGRRSLRPRVLLYALALGLLVLYWLAPWRGDPVRESLERTERRIEEGKKAGLAIRERESQVWLRGEPLPAADLDAIRHDLQKVIAADEEMHRHLDLLRRTRESPGDTETSLHRELLRTKLAVLDADEVLEGKDGIFIPMHRALDRLRKAEADKAAGEIEAVEKDLRALAAKIREGLARPELRAAELAELEEIEIAARRAAELRGAGPGAAGPGAGEADTAPAKAPG